MSKLKQMQKNLNEQTENIIEHLQVTIENNPYLLSQLKKLDDGKYDYRSTNDMGGVDFRIEFQLKEMGPFTEEVDKEILQDAIDTFLEDRGAYYNRKDDELNHSSCEEIFISDNNEVIFPTTDFIDRPKIQDDFHAWLLIEQWMLESGCYPGIYSLDYYGGVSDYKFDDSYKVRFSDDDKIKASQIEDYLIYYTLKEEINDYTVQLDSIPDKHFELLSVELKNVFSNSSGGIQVTEVKEITFDKITICLELDDKLKNTNAKLIETGTLNTWYVYEIEIRLTPNSVRFALEDDEPTNQGGIYELSMLSVG